MENKMTWNDFIEICNHCQNCGLAATRQNVVVYRGAVRAPLMLVGEAPGADEDRQAKPFVGAAGKLLDLLIHAFGFPEDAYHICNIVKCRPPENRVPTPDESKACKALLATQFKFVRPKIIVLLGATAYKNFTGSTEGITKVRGEWIEKNGYLIMPTLHPAYILRNNNERISLWKDLEKVRLKMEERGLLEPLFSSPQMPPGRCQAGRSQSGQR